MLRKLTLIAGVLAMLATAVPALAQRTGPHGGLVAGTGTHQTELLVSPTELTVYLLEGGKVHDSKGSTLRAVLQQSGTTTTINFVEQKGQNLVAKLPAPLDKGAIVVLTGKDHHGDQFNARYVLK